jgi:polysaccharide export outer membrane protein
MAKGLGSSMLRQFRVLFEEGTVAALSDGQLLERFLAKGPGAEAAFAALVARHGPMVLGVCRRTLADPDDAADAFQATFLILARKARWVRVDDSLGRWLYGVGRRVAARAKVVASRRPKGDQAELASIAAPSVDPDRFERLALLDEELGRLPEAFRSAIVLCDLGGLTHEEAARDLLIPVGTIKSRLARGRRKLRERLERRGLTPSALALPPIVPAALAGETARLAAMVGSKAAGMVPAASVVLAQEVLKTMTGFKLKLAASAVLSLGVVATGSGMLARGQDGAGKPAEAKPQPAEMVLGEVNATDVLPIRSIEMVNGRIELDGKRTTLKRLTNELKTSEGKPVDPRQRITIRAASDQNYAEVAQVVEAVRAAGLRDIRFESAPSSRPEARLNQPVSIFVEKGPLREAVALLTRYTGLNIVFDPKAVAGPFPTQETPVTVKANALPLSRVLTMMLRPIGLDYEVVDDVIVIRTPPAIDFASRNKLFADGYRKLELAKGVLAQVEKTASGPADPQVVRQKLRIAELEAALEKFNAAIQTFQGADGEALTHQQGAFRPKRVEELVQTTQPGVKPAAGPSRELSKVTMPSYVVEPPDIVTVEVLKALPDRPITGERLVKPDGTINLGYYGQVYVAGLNLAEVKEKVVLHLRKYIEDADLGLVVAVDEGKTLKTIDPKDSSRVFVDVAAYNSKVYYVQGDVGVPGRLPITGNETVLDAINYAGGLIPTASKTNIRLVRPAPPGATTGEATLPVDLDAIVKKGDTTTNYQLFPGDRVVVYRDPETEAEVKARLAPSDVEARLQAVERKLDEVLKALDRTPKP